MQWGLKYSTRKVAERDSAFWVDWTSEGGNPVFWISRCILVFSSPNSTGHWSHVTSLTYQCWRTNVLTQGGLFVMILVSKLFLRWEWAPALSQGRTLFLLMLGRVRRGTAVYPDVFHRCDFWSHLLQVTCALSAAWASCFVCMAILGTMVLLHRVLVPLQLSTTIVLSVLLCENCVLMPQDVETSVVTVWWKAAMAGSHFYLRFV